MLSSENQPFLNLWPPFFPESWSQARIAEKRPDLAQPLINTLFPKSAWDYSISLPFLLPFLQKNAQICEHEMFKAMSWKQNKNSKIASSVCRSGLFLQVSKGGAVANRLPCVGLRIKRSSVRIRPWPLRWVLGQGSLLPLSQGEAFTLASISYLATLVKYILAKKKKTQSFSMTLSDWDQLGGGHHLFSTDVFFSDFFQIDILLLLTPLI